MSKRFPVRRSWVDSIRTPFGREWATVLDDVTCDVAAGEFFGVLGPNGAGKTTLFRILSSTVLPDSGSVRVNGLDVTREARAARRVLTAVPAEERSLNWRLSARENLDLFGRLHGLTGRALTSRIDELLEVVELEDAKYKMVSKFSSGMKQRLMIARALLGRPRILLLDEPTRALDPLGARRLREFLRTELVGRQRCTVVLATHNSEEALELCDRVAVMDRGRLLAVGPAASLARELLGERYLVTTRDPQHPAWHALVREGLLAAEPAPVPGEGEEGWVSLELSIPGGADGAARLLARLSAAGVAISSFRPLQPGLADLIEKIIHRSLGEAPHA